MNDKVRKTEMGVHCWQTEESPVYSANSCRLESLNNKDDPTLLEITVGKMEFASLVPRSC